MMRPNGRVALSGSHSFGINHLDEHPKLYAWPMPELPEVEAWVRELDPLVSRAPIEVARPGHVATLKTFDPPPSRAGRTRLRGCTAAREEPPLPDR